MLSFAALCTTIYLLMMGWYNVLTLDDYGCIADVDNYGVFGYVQNMYMTWQGRWSAFLIDAIYYKVWGHASNLVTFTMFQLVIGYITVYYILKKTISVQRDIVLASVSVLLVNLSILALQEISTFYWLCCPHYILCVWAFIWLCYLLFSPKDYQWWHIILTIFLSLYLSGIAETFTPLVIMILGIKWLFNIFKEKRYNFVQQPNDRYLTISLLVLVAGFLIMVLAPGNASRIDSMSNNSFIGHFVLSSFLTKWCKATAILFLRFISKSLYYMAICIIAMWMGYIYRENAILEAVVLDVKKAIYLSILLVLFFAISVAPCVYAMGWYAPPRSFSYMSFVFAFYAMWLGLSIGYKIRRVIILECAMILTTAAVSICAIAWCVQEQSTLSEYYAWVTKCQKEIRVKAQEGDDTPYMIRNYKYPAHLNTYSQLCKKIKKNRIEYQYPYMIFEVDKDPSSWKNQGLNQYYHANFEIIAEYE